MFNIPLRITSTFALCGLLLIGTSASVYAIDASSQDNKDRLQRREHGEHEKDNRRGFERDRRGERRGAEGSRSRRGGSGKKLTEKQIQQGITIFRELYPDINPRLKEYKDKNPEKYTKFIRSRVQRSWHRIAPMINDKKNNPELYKLKIKDFQLDIKASRIASALTQDKNKDKPKAKSSEKSKRYDSSEFVKATKNDLRKVLTEQFEVRVKIQRIHLSNKVKNKDKEIERDLKRYLSRNQFRGPRSERMKKEMKDKKDNSSKSR